MRDSFYIVELFSGNGSVSRILSKVLCVKAVRIDMDPDQGADITMDITQWDQAAADEVKRMAGATPANRKRGVVWASPPCTEYTTLKRGRPRNLAAADACVAAIARIAADLDAVMVLVENPGTGLLKERTVIQHYPHSVTLDYCQYGYGYRKRTMLWSSLPLPASFPARTCPGHPACPNTYINKETRKPCHVINMLTDEGLQQRISVPDQLACLLGRALAELLPPLAHEPAPPATPSQKAKQRKCWEVDFVEQACMEDGVLWLRVAWVGYDLPTWITASKLNAPPGEYDFETPELRDWVVARHEALQRHSQRKRAHEEQQQQQQRKTRSRGAADGGSSSSSSSSATVSLADPLLADGYSP